MRKLVVALLVLVGTIGLPPNVTQVAAADGLRIEATNTYTVDGTTGGVRVQIDIKLTNQIPDRTTGNIIRQTYFDAFGFLVDETAQNLTVTSKNGNPLSFTLEPDADSGLLALRMDLARNIFFGQSSELSVAYDLIGDAPRSDSDVRINPAYASFPAYGVGDPGLTNVRIVIPDFYETETLGSDVERSLGSGFVIYSADAIENPLDFGVFVSARNDAALTSDRVTIDDNDYAIKSWPGDEAWAAFIKTQIDDGLPVLADLIGREWPYEQRFTIRQTNTPYLYGYAGWFSPVNFDIEVGEDLDQETMLHELSHAWFNSELFDERWLNEGFAQVYSNAAMEELGGTPGKPTVPRSTDANGFELNKWNDLALDDNAEAEEEYGYNTSWWVIDEVIDEIGFDAMREVIDEVAGDELPYEGRATAERDATTVYSWQRMLDWIELDGNDDEVQQLFIDWVLTDADVALLELRNKRRADFAALVDKADTWSAPAGIRVDMAGWEFTGLEEDFAAATDVLEVRNDLRDASKRVGVTIPGSFQTAYQESVNEVDLSATEGDLADQLDAVEAVETAMAGAAEERDFLTKVGLIGSDVDPPLEVARGELSAGNPDAAREAAAESTRLLAEADEVGKGRVIRSAIGLAVFLFVLLAVVLLLRRRKRRRRAAAEAEAAAAAAAAVAAAESELPTEIEEPADVEAPADDEAPVDVDVSAEVEAAAADEGLPERD
jgi:hypothetical protein